MTAQTDATATPRTGPSPDDAVLFVHIPKTAGMSLHNSMVRRFGPDHSLRYRGASPKYQEMYLQLSEADLARYRLLSGHFELPLWLRRDVGDRYVVSVVREPVERILSAYRYAKSWKEHPRHAELAHMSVAEFVDDHLNDGPRRNLQCRKLCGAADCDDALRMARQHVDLLGAVEVMDRFVAALGERLGVALEDRRDNRSPDQTPTRADLEPALIARLESGNAEDVKLWNYVTRQGLVLGHR